MSSIICEPWKNACQQLSSFATFGRYLLQLIFLAYLKSMLVSLESA